MTPRRRRPAAAALCAGLLASASASAHDSDYSYLRLQVDGAQLTGVWEVHQRDALLALGLPLESANAGSSALETRESEYRALLARSLTLATDAGPCPTRIVGALEPGAEDPEYVRAHVEADCPAPIDRLQLGYTLLFALDPEHRGFFAADDAHQTHLGTFSREQQQLSLSIRQLDRVRAFHDYAVEGMRHILGGADHLLFLLALLLPAPLERRGAQWQAREHFAPTLGAVVRVVTAFTLAHSLTLTLSVLGVVRLPPRLVEASIAASVFAAAWNNLRPFLPGRGWALALGFGLVHGLGFAGALTQLGLPRAARGLALLAFNLGVEAGQLLLVAGTLPLLHAARRTRLYRLGALRLGSLAIAWIAAIWLLERSFGLDLIPD